MFEKIKIKWTLLCALALLTIFSCEENGVESKYSKGQFVGKWQAYRKGAVTKSQSNEILEDKTTNVSPLVTIQLKENGLSAIENDPSSVCEWALRGEKLNVGCSDFYIVDQYSPSQFVLRFSLKSNKTEITNYIYYKRVN